MGIDRNAQYQKAKPLLIKILCIDKNHFYANYTYGIYLRDVERNYNLSLKCLQIAHNAQPNNIQIIIDIAKLYKYAKDIEMAKSFYLKAIKINDSDCYANMEYAHFCAIIGQFKLSDFYYRKVLNLIKNNDPDSNDMLNNINMVENYTNYGHVLHKLHRNEEAIAVVKRAHILNPQDCNTLNNLGYYNYVIANYEESEKYLKLCLEINPLHEFTNSTYGNLLYDMNKYEEAIVYFKNALKLDSDIKHPEIGPKVLYNYSMILYDKKEYNQSIKHCEQLINEEAFKDYDNMDKVYYLMAKSYDAIGSVQSAFNWISKAYKINPQNEQYQTMYHLLHL